MKQRAWRPVRVLVYGRDEYFVHPDRTVYRRGPRGQMQRVQDKREINVAHAQLNYDTYVRLSKQGKWPAGQPRPVPPHIPGPRPQHDHELERAIAETRGAVQYTSVPLPQIVIETPAPARVSVPKTSRLRALLMRLTSWWRP